MSQPLLLSVCDHSGEWSRPYLGTARVARVDPKHGRDVDQGGRGLTERGATGAKIKIMADGGEGWPVTAGELVDRLRGGLVLPRVSGLLMAPPCTDFAVSGNQWWPAKDVDGRTAVSIQIINDCLDLVELLDPDWWVLENPAGRLATMIPRLVEMQDLRSARGLLLPRARMTFHPHHFAGHADDPESEAYTKLTCLWGRYNPELVRASLPPVMHEYVSKTGATKRGSKLWASTGGKSERVKELRSKTPQGFSRAFAAANPVVQR